MSLKSYSRFLPKYLMFFLCSLAFSTLIGVDPASSQQTLMWRDLFGVEFPTENEGWVCGRRGIIAHSEDGGDTWSRQTSNTPYTLASIKFVNNQVGWAVGDGGTILHTEDGGKTWVKQASPVKNYLMGLDFVNENTGWISTGEATILHTKDAGKTWEVQFKDEGEDLILRSVSFCDDNNGWAAGEYGYIYHTADGGKSWEKQAGFVRISWETEELESGNFLFGLHAVDPQTAWAVGLGKTIIRTTDGGATWEEIDVDIIPEVHLFAVMADKAGNVFIGGNGVLITSSDGAKTFKNARVDPPITYARISDIAHRRSKGLVAVGNEGLVYGLAVMPFGDWKIANYTK